MDNTLPKQQSSQFQKSYWALEHLLKIALLLLYSFISVYFSLVQLLFFLSLIYMHLYIICICMYHKKRPESSNLPLSLAVEKSPLLYVYYLNSTIMVSYPWMGIHVVSFRKMFKSLISLIQFISCTFTMCPALYRYKTYSNEQNQYGS